MSDTNIAPTGTDKPRHIVVTLHGIRTFGQWQERFAALVALSDATIAVQNYKYGYFSVLAFLLPFTRWIVVRRFRQSLMHLSMKHPGAVIDLIAHSFGTYVAAWGLAAIPPSQRPKIRTAILSGSVLKSTFPWNALIDSGCVATVINECGTRDSVLILNQLVVLFTGMAGRIGFAGMTGVALHNNFHDFGHSGYFQTSKGTDDTFMQTRWLPAVLAGQIPDRVDSRSTGGPISGLLMFLAQNTEPIKLFVFVSPFVLLMLLFASLYTGALSRELAFVSRLHLEERVDLAALIARAAMNTRVTREARGALMESMNAEPDLHGFIPLKAEASTAIAFLRGGKRIAYGDRAGCVEIAELDDVGASRPRKCGHRGSVLNMATSLDGQLLASSGRDNAIRFWSPRDLSEALPPLERVLDHGTFVYGVVIHPDGRRLISLGERGSIIEWDLTTRRRYRLRIAGGGAKGAMFTGAFSPDGRWLAAAGVDGVVALWDCSGTRCGRSGVPILEAKAPVPTVAFDPSGKQLAVGTDKGAVHVRQFGFDKEREKVLSVESRVESLAFDAPGKRIVIGTLRNAVQIFDTQTAARIRLPFNTYARDTTTMMAMSLESGLVAVATQEPFIPILDLGSYLDEPHRLALRDERLDTVRTTANEEFVAVATRNNRIIVSDRIGSRQYPDLQATTNPSVIDDWLITSMDGTVAVYVSSPIDGFTRWTLRGDEWVNDTKFTDVGSTFCLARGRWNHIATGWRSIRLYHVSANQGRKVTIQKLIDVDKEGDDSVVACEFSPDGRMLVIGHQSGRVSVWKVATRQMLSVIETAVPGMGTLRYSHDGKWLAAAGGRRITLFRESIRRGHFDKVADLWGHKGTVREIRFSPDGTMLASMAKNSEILAWDIDTLALTARLRTPDEEEIADLAFLRSGGILVASGYGRTGRLLEVDSARLMEGTCALANRSLTGEEIQQLLPEVNGMIRAGLARLWGGCGGRELLDQRVLDASPMTGE